MCWDLWNDFITWILVLAGWIVVWLQLRALHTRQDIRKYIEDIEHDLTKLEELAVAYHTAEKRNDRLGTKIKGLLAALFYKVDSMSLLGHYHAALLTYPVRKSITLENFDTDDFKQQSDDSKLMNNVVDKIANLEQELHLSYARKYLKRRWVFR